MRTNYAAQHRRRAATHGPIYYAPFAVACFTVLGGIVVVAAMSADGCVESVDRSRADSEVAHIARKAVLSRVKYPAEASLGVPVVRKLPNGKWSVVGIGTAKNGFGVRERVKYRVILTDRMLVDLVEVGSY